jgi:hypothetical protein
MLKKWIAQRLFGRGDQDLEPIPEDASLEGLNLKEVLDAHDAWKTRLVEDLEGRTEIAVDPAIISSDRHCTLGKWLHGPGKRYSRLPEYDRAVQAHADFHVCAAEVVIENRSGHRERAEQLLKTRFRHASSANQLELVRLFSAIKQ